VGETESDVAGYGFGAVEVACAQPCITGESPVWDHRIGRLHWVDIRSEAVFTLDPGSGIVQRVPAGEQVGFVALTAKPDVVVAGLKSGLYTLNLKTATKTLLCTVDADKPGNRINDGTVASDGAILFGTLDCDYQAANGSFWRFHKGALSSLGGAMIITNGPGVSTDGKTVLTVDSIARRIERNSYSKGALTPQGLFAEIPIGQGVPDGVAFDVDGFAWIAHYGGGRISRFRPDGSVDRVVNLPVQQVTKCAFGGPELKTLFITTAAHRRSLADEPLAGALFSVPVETAGPRAVIADV
jgi:sugar lactone lactonase YvrE